MLDYRERAGLLLLQSFPNGGATDIVFVTLFCIAVGTVTAWCCGHCAMPNGHYLNIQLFWWRSTAALVFRVGACFEVSLFYPPFLLVPSLIGLLASVDVKKQKLTHSETNSLQSMTRPHRCWFIINIWKSDHLSKSVTLWTPIHI